MRRTLILFFLVLAMPLHTAMAAERWEALPPTPAPVPGLQTGHAELNGIRLFYAEIGQGSPVVVLHGGLANSDYLGNQVRRSPDITALSWWTAADMGAARATTSRSDTT